MLLRKHSIYKRILLPLLGVMVFEAILFYATVIIGGPLDLLQENSVHIMRQNIVNRQITLQNEMVQRWSNLESCVGSVTQQTEQFLQQNHVTPQRLRTDAALSQRYLEKVSSTLLYTLRKNSVNGIFIILDDVGEMTPPKTAHDYRTLHFRDMDVSSASEDYSDILMERGPASIAGTYHISLDTFWTPKARYFPSDDTRNMDYFFEPLFAARENPLLSYKNLGRWSSPYFLGEAVESDTDEVIAYSVPLVYGEEVYGVLGIEVTAASLQGLIPSKELDQNGRGGYLLVTRPLEGEETQDPMECRIEFVSGGFLNQAAREGEVVQLKKDAASGLFLLQGRLLHGEPIYADLCDLSLYNTNTPFSAEQWALVGISNREVLFGISDRMKTSVFFSTVVSLLVGLACVYFICWKTTRPLSRMVEKLRWHNPLCALTFEKSNVLELDELAQVIADLDLKRRIIERDLQKERERYLLALESTTNIILEYDNLADTLTMYKFVRDKDRSEVRPRIYTQMRQRITAGEICPKEDVRGLLDFFEGRSDTVIFRSKEPEDGKNPEEYMWFFAKGQAVRDAETGSIRVTGSSRDITEEKKRELAEQEENRRDKVTRLYKREVGEAAIRAWLEQQGSSVSGYLCMIDIDGFSKLNTHFGILYCNLLLEEVGAVLSRRIKKENGVLMRLGGDEFVFCLFDIPREWAYETVESICEDVSSIYVDEDRRFCLTCSAGMAQVVPGLGYEVLLSQAGCALRVAKEDKKKHTIVFDSNCCDGMMPEHKITDIVTMYYDVGDNIVSIAFNLFEKSSDVKSTFPVLFGKIGRMYGFRRIMLIGCDLDFCTSQIDFQWAAPGVQKYEKKIGHYDEKTLEELQWLFRDKGAFLIGPKATIRLPSSCAQLLHCSEKIGAYCCAMYDNGRFCGSVVFYGGEVGTFWKEKDFDNLRETVNILCAHLSKSRADLASKAKSDFLSRMSHEIRTPMNAIMGMTTIALHENPLSPKLYDCLSKIDISAKYLLSLINDILDMSRIESGKMTLENDAFDLRSVVRELDALVRPQAESKKIDLIVEESLQDSWFMGDSLRLNQVMINLIGNAVKFTGEEGEIHVRIEQRETEKMKAKIFFAVQDTGIGIAAENITRIFNAFEQAQDNTARKFGGTGLGLAISSNLVKMMGGKLEVRSSVGVGATFYFTLQLPVSEPMQPSSAIAGNDAPTEMDFAGKRVLLVEDNDLNVEIAQTILEATGFVVEVAWNGQEAVDVFSKSECGYFDVILMDIRMPVMDGLEATRAIRLLERADARTVPIIAMTANAFDEDMKKSIESGMNGHLAKPFDVSELYKLLLQVLHQI